MNKKTWVKIKRGLIIDPKHRRAMGDARWLYDFILDITDWETGTVAEWTDTSAAEMMDMPISTLRKQRRKLDDANYITCQKTQRGQKIIVHKWTNPREYDPTVINPKPQSDQKRPHGEVPSDRPSDRPSIVTMVTPSIDSHDHIVTLKNSGKKPRSPAQKTNDEFFDAVA